MSTNATSGPGYKWVPIPNSHSIIDPKLIIERLRYFSNLCIPAKTRFLVSSQHKHLQEGNSVLRLFRANVGKPSLLLQRKLLYHLLLQRFNIVGKPGNI